MAEVTKIHNPSFNLFPVNNDRTAWRPVGLPVILVVPDRRDSFGNPIDNSDVFNIRVAIEDVPRKSLVAGHDHVGLLSPDKELFAENISRLELSERQIDLTGQVFIKSDGSEATFEEAVSGDLMEYTTVTGIKDTITYLPTANYYDLSDVTLEIEELPSDFYYLTYNCEYFVRELLGGEAGQLLCVDSSRTATAVLRFRLNHPGHVLEEFYRHTPPPYLTNTAKSSDSTVALYRPFTDALQDILDEQWLLENINWVGQGAA